MSLFLPRGAWIGHFVIGDRTWYQGVQYGWDGVEHTASYAFRVFYSRILEHWDGKVIECSELNGPLVWKLVRQKW